MCYNKYSEREIGWLHGSLKGISLGATTLVCRFCDYLIKISHTNRGAGLVFS